MDARMTKLITAIIYSVSLSVCFVTMVFAYTGYGICNYGGETVPAVVCYGPAVLKGTTVSGDLKVAGPLTADSVTAGSLTITGSAQMINSKVKGAVVITGNFNATNVNFNQTINITSDNIQLHHVKIKGSVMVSSTDSTPYVVIDCGSIISGDVVFSGKAGVIQITDDSIVQGRVHNGAMEFVKHKC